MAGSLNKKEYVDIEIKNDEPHPVAIFPDTDPNKPIIVKAITSEEAKMQRIPRVRRRGAIWEGTTGDGIKLRVAR